MIHVKQSLDNFTPILVSIYLQCWTSDGSSSSREMRNVLDMLSHLVLLRSVIHVLVSKGNTFDITIWFLIKFTKVGGFPVHSSPDPVGHINRWLNAVNSPF